jgi:hypothetical protein
MDPQRHQLIQQALDILSSLLLSTDPRRATVREWQNKEKTLVSTGLTGVKGAPRTYRKKQHIRPSEWNEYQKRVLPAPKRTEEQVIAHLRDAMADYKLVAGRGESERLWLHMSSDLALHWTRPMNDTLLMQWGNKRARGLWPGIQEAIANAPHQEWEFTTRYQPMWTALFLIRESETTWRAMVRARGASLDYIDYFETTRDDQGLGYGGIAFALTVRALLPWIAAPRFLRLQNAGGAAGCTIYFRGARANGLTPFGEALHVPVFPLELADCAQKAEAHWAFLPLADPGPPADAMANAVVRGFPQSGLSLRTSTKTMEMLTTEEVWEMLFRECFGYESHPMRARLGLPQREHQAIRWFLHRLGFRSFVAPPSLSTKQRIGRYYPDMYVYMETVTLKLDKGTVTWCKALEVLQPPHWNVVVDELKGPHYACFPDPLPPPTKEERDTLVWLLPLLRTHNLAHDPARVRSVRPYVNPPEEHTLTHLRADLAEFKQVAQHKHGQLWLDASRRRALCVLHNFLEEDILWWTWLDPSATATGETLHTSLVASLKEWKSFTYPPWRAVVLHTDTQKWTPVVWVGATYHSDSDTLPEGRSIRFVYFSSKDPAYSALGFALALRAFSAIYRRETNIKVRFRLPNDQRGNDHVHRIAYYFGARALGFQPMWTYDDLPVFTIALEDIAQAPKDWRLLPPDDAMLHVVPAAPGSIHTVLGIPSRDARMSEQLQVHAYPLSYVSSRLLTSTPSDALRQKWQTADKRNQAMQWYMHAWGFRLFLPATDQREQDMFFSGPTSSMHNPVALAEFEKFPSIGLTWVHALEVLHDSYWNAVLLDIDPANSTAFAHFPDPVPPLTATEAERLKVLLPLLKERKVPHDPSRIRTLYQIGRQEEETPDLPPPGFLKTFLD